MRSLNPVAKKLMNTMVLRMCLDNIYNGVASILTTGSRWLVALAPNIRFLFFYKNRHSYVIFFSWQKKKFSSTNVNLSFLSQWCSKSRLYRSLLLLHVYGLTTCQMCGEWVSWFPFQSPYMAGKLLSVPTCLINNSNTVIKKLILFSLVCGLRIKKKLMNA